MKRSSKKKSGNDDGILIRKQTLDKLLREKRADDMIALYFFYSYTALWQRTNQPHATLGYVAKGLHWGKDKVRAVRLLLRNLGMIEDVRVLDPRTKRVARWFVKVAYFHPTCFPDGGVSQRVESRDPNALRANKKTLGTDTGNPLRAGTRSSHRSDRTRHSRKRACRRLSSPDGFLEDLPEETSEAIRHYNSELVPLGWLPVTKFSAELERAFDRFEPATVLDFVDSVVENSEEICIPKRRTLVRLLWDNIF